MTFSDKLQTWFFDAWTELAAYFATMSVVQWCVLAGCAVIFGFLCLKGNPIRR